MAKYPFEVPFEGVMRDTEPYVDAIFSCLESEFTAMPRGPGFIEYSVFEQGYEALKAASPGFTRLDPSSVLQAALTEPVSVVVLRTMLGFTPPEWAYVATRRTGVNVSQGFARSLDRKVRASHGTPLKSSDRLKALVETACDLLSEGAPRAEDGKLHRLDKADTRHGLESVQSIAAMGVPYAMLLYERFLGRPFAGHRDSVSELIGNTLELAVEGMLDRAGISHRKTKRAERVAGFDQAPDFIVPDELSPQIVIEAKITEDDGTARDKVTRVQHLAELSAMAGEPDRPKFEVIACIGGRGFGVRRQDMKKLLIATRGKVFTLKTLDLMVDNTCPPGLPYEMNCRRLFFLGALKGLGGDAHRMADVSTSSFGSLTSQLANRKESAISASSAAVRSLSRPTTCGRIAASQWWLTP